MRFLTFFGFRGLGIRMFDHFVTELSPNSATPELTSSIFFLKQVISVISLDCSRLSTS